MPPGGGTARRLSTSSPKVEQRQVRTCGQFKTAEASNFTVPPTIMIRANEVIE